MRVLQFTKGDAEVKSISRRTFVKFLRDREWGDDMCASIADQVLVDGERYETELYVFEREDDEE